MRIGYLSDLHLEFRDYPDFSKDGGGDLLFLGGDILVAKLLEKHRTDAAARKLQKYLTGPFYGNLLSKYKKVIYIMGNHEYYHSTFSDKTMETIRDWFRNNLPYVDIQFPKHTAFGFGDTIVWVDTFWSDFDNQHPLSMRAAEEGMNDYHYIYRGDTEDPFPSAIKPIDTLRKHLISRSNLFTSLENNREKQFVVMTHHAPSFKSINRQRYTNTILDGAYASDMKTMIMQFPNIKYWVHGHTHLAADYEIGQCRVLSNPMGYSMEPTFKNFTGTKHIDI